MKRVTLSPCLLPSLFGACGDGGANYTPILDGASTGAFRSDLAACQALARDQRRFDHETAGATVLGAGAGALPGMADDDGDVLGGAAAGTFAGGVASAISASERREAIVVQCLRGRGHRVVG